MDSMDFNELFSLLQSGDESERIEAKSASLGIGKSFLETVCAYCNEPDLGGGYILLGVSKNENGNSPRYIINKIADLDKLQNEITSQCRQCFNVPIRPTLKVVNHPQGDVLLVYISEVNAHEKPIFIKSKGLDKGAYRRIGPSDQICTREDLDLLYQLRSRRKFDETPEDRASLHDFDVHAIQAYRIERARIKEDAPELNYSDQDLLQALQATITERGSTLPTIGGLLLFGTPNILQRLYPLKNRIDYMLVEGREWVGDPDRRYTALEMCEPLLTGIPRLLSQIMNDIPQIFALGPDQLQRMDNPIIPRKVIREALVNSIMHKDYRISSPLQIIKYANRIEFRNAGYSLKPPEQLGLPGSIQRNEVLSKVFHNIHYAEAKGTGIGAMREEMKKVNLSVPLIESDRAGNLFVLTLLPHHLFDKKDIEWLGHFKSYNLTNEEARTLIIIREMGAITNADYRTINAVDTLVASSHLRRLRDLGLLEQKGRGNTTYYVPTENLLIPLSSDVTHSSSGSEQLATHTSPLSEQLATHTSPLSEQLATHTSPLTESSIPQIDALLTELPKELQLEVKKMGKRTPFSLVQQTIFRLCMIRPFQPAEIAQLLKRSPRYIRDYFLKSMVDSGELELTFPNNPTHPLQAYRAKKGKLNDL